MPSSWQRVSISSYVVVERDVAHLIFPDDVQTQPAAGAEPSPGPAGRVALPRVVPDESVVSEVLARIAAAERPIIIVGYGALDGMGEEKEEHPQREQRAAVSGQPPGCQQCHQQCGRPPVRESRSGRPDGDAVVQGLTGRPEGHAQVARVWQEEDGGVHSPIEDERLFRDLLFPGYALADQDGALHEVASLEKRPPALYIFYRGHW